MIVQSNLTGQNYNDSDCVFFRNMLQSAWYFFKGAKLIDLFVDDKLKFVFCFSKKDHDKLKLEWKNRKEVVKE